MTCSGTSRRFSRPSATSAVMSGASSVIRSVCFFGVRQLDRVDSGVLGPLGRAAGEDEPHHLSLVVAVARHQHHRVPADRELARPARCVAGGRSRDRSADRPAAAAVSDWPRCSSKGRANTRGSARCISPLHPGVDHPREDHPVVGHHRGQQDERDADAEEGVALPARRQATPAASPRLRLRGGRFRFGGCHRGSKSGRHASLVRRSPRHDGS